MAAMTAVQASATSQSPSLISTSLDPPLSPSSYHSRIQSPSLSDDAEMLPGDADSTAARTRKERPCDACRRRKSKCIVDEGASACQYCGSSRQACTFVENPIPRKRRLRDEELNAENNKKRSPEAEARGPLDSLGETISKDGLISPLPESANVKPQSLPPPHESLGSLPDKYAVYVGSSTELDRCLLDLSRPGQGREETATSREVRNVSTHDTFLINPDQDVVARDPAEESLVSIQEAVDPHGPALIELYFTAVHPSFPILDRTDFMENYHNSPEQIGRPLLASILVLALRWWSADPRSTVSSKPDISVLENLALESLEGSYLHPKLSTIQAGLLLLQRDGGSSWVLTSKLVAIGEELGLHLDCSTWQIPEWEKGVRKRLAWALFMQDKWGALIHGRPSHIVMMNWAVRPLADEDFEHATAMIDNDVHQGLDKPSALFRQMIMLTGVLSDVLDSLYSLKANQEVDAAGKDGTRMILERAKPIQMKLKQWFVNLPSNLRMDSAVEPYSPTGSLLLAYFATEISLHRRIIHSLAPMSKDLYLLHICRSAAKTRLISAMDFVNRLKPDHLNAFWYFSSAVSFALIATFGSLLCATAPSKQEAAFYRQRLSEYRWTLTVSSKRAEFMQFAVRTLDASTSLLDNQEEKPVFVPDAAGNDSVDENGDEKPSYINFIHQHNLMRLHSDSESFSNDQGSLKGAVSTNSEMLSPSSSDAGSFEAFAARQDEMRGYDVCRNGVEEDVFEFLARVGVR